MLLYLRRPKSPCFLGINDYGCAPISPFNLLALKKRRNSVDFLCVSGGNYDRFGHVRNRDRILLFASINNNLSVLMIRDENLVKRHQVMTC